MGAPDVFKVGGEAFIEPGLGPLAAGDEIAPPLVGQLVCDQGLDVQIEGGALVEHGFGRECGGGGVFHAAEDEVLDEDLAVAPKRVGHADGLREKINERWCGGKAAFEIGLATLGSVVIHIDAGFAGAFLDFGEVAAHQGHQVRRVRKIQDVVPQGVAVAELAPFAQIAVRENKELCGRGAQHLAGGFQQRRIDAREIETRVFVLALRPTFSRPAWMGFVRSDEVKPAHGRTVVGDGDGKSVATRAQASKLDAQTFAVVMGGLGRHSVDRDGGEGHVHCVQFDRLEVIPTALQREGDPAAQGPCLQIRRQFEPHMRDGDGTVRGEVGLGTGRYKGSWHGLRTQKLLRNARPG